MSGAQPLAYFSWYWSLVESYVWLVFRGLLCLVGLVGGPCLLGLGGGPCLLGLGGGPCLLGLGGGPCLLGLGGGPCLKIGRAHV